MTGDTLFNDNTTNDNKIITQKYIVFSFPTSGERGDAVRMATK